MNLGEWVTREGVWEVEDLLENRDLGIERMGEERGLGRGGKVGLELKGKFKMNGNGWGKVFGR